MENKIAASSSMHPMLWVAAISVTLLSFAGIASLTGLLPAKSTTAPAPVASISTPAPAYTPPAATPATPEAPAAAVVPAPAAEPAVVVPHATQHKAQKKNIAAHSPAKTSGGMPPPAGAGIPPDYTPPPVSSAPASPCANCGEITGIRQITREGQGTGLGAVAGGVLGGVLGNNVGNGNGRTLATIAGAIGGGFLGNKVEKTQRESAAYQISVRMEDGTTQVIEAATAPSWRTGDQVRLVNGTIVGR